VVITGFFIGFVGALVSFILRQLGAQQALLGTDDIDYLGIATAIEYCLRIHPAFSFSKALFYILNAEYIALIYNSPDMSVWSFHVILIDFLFLSGQILIYFLLALYIDRKITHPGVFKWFNVTSTSIFIPSYARDKSTPDEDVIAEEKRVRNGDSKDDSIVIYDLVKQYGSDTIAVNHVSLGIPPGECFGLLGTNGAGKYSYSFHFFLIMIFS
jgi:ABC-type multidrug transport system fused ATPase/permease subunit